MSNNHLLSINWYNKLKLKIVNISKNIHSLYETNNNFNNAFKFNNDQYY